jgi:hypothetical protein
MDIKQVNIVCFGDLYRFYVDDANDVIAVHFYPFMGTQHQVVRNIEDVPQEVIDKLEHKLST